MEQALLQTKLYIPRPRLGMVARERLTTQLDAALEAQSRLILITAPAGSGKTTLTADWVRRWAQRWTEGRVAWLSLEADDNDPVHLLIYLRAALGVPEPAQREGVSAWLSGQPSILKTALTQMVNHLAVEAHPTVLVLDDYHVIEQDLVHQSISYLVEHSPPTTCIVILSRTEPPLGLARLRVRHQLVELRAADLRFTEAEATAFLEAMGLHASPELINAIQEQTEGWGAGLQLAALSLRDRRGSDARVFTLRGSHRHVVEYLAQEVLSQQPEPVRDFLLETAILERFSAALCQAVTGRDDSTGMLDYLERANLFLVPLDEERRWFRYHHLFAEFLRSSLQAHASARLQLLHQRAARWFEAQGMITDAVGHAFSAEDYPSAARLIKDSATRLIMRGETNVLLSWFDRLPRYIRQALPDLELLYLEALAVAGDHATAEAVLKDVRAGFLGGAFEEDRQSAESVLDAVESYLNVYKGDLGRSVALALRAKEGLPPGNVFLKDTIDWLVSFSSYFTGHDADAMALVEQTRLASLESGNALMISMATFLLHNLYQLQGALHESRRILDEGLARITALATDATQERALAESSPPGLSLIYQGLAGVCREMGLLDEAEAYLRPCIELSERWGNAEVLTDVYILLARTRQAQGDLEAATAALEKARAVTQRSRVSILTQRQVEAYEARLARAKRDMDAAEHWAAQWERAYAGEPIVPGHTVSFAQAVEQIAVMDIRIAQGRYAEARALAEALLPIFSSCGWRGIVFALQAALALALAGLRAMPEALSTLERAVNEAVPAGFIRTLVDFGEPMATLLKVAFERGIATKRVQELLAALVPGEPGTSRRPLSASALLDALSERELDVLRLIADGLTNREVAAKLFVAESTVKTHINHIYQKLGVTNRTQALARAHELGLL